MMWSELYGQDKEPTFRDIEKFIGGELWQALGKFIEDTYGISPLLSYSRCAMDGGAWKGWNVKYKKSGKALCTLYPKQGYFVALIVIGNKEIDEAEMVMPSCSEYIQKLYKNSSSMDGKWLAVNVTDKKILEDLEMLIGIRVPVKNKRRKQNGV